VRQRAHDVMLAAAREAAKVIMRVYADGFDVEWKGADDPVTRADREANALLVARLGAAFPGVPIVAEESDASAYDGWEAAPVAFFVDPLDGTRDFVARNGEFCVMLGLAEAGVATAGVIVCPALARTFTAVVGDGAWEHTPDGARRPLRASEATTLAEAEVLVSRSRGPKDLDAARARIGARKVTPCGSAGVKAARVATGEADVYVHAPPGGGMLWDACAGDALVTAAGGVFETKGGRFDYQRGPLRCDGVLATATPALAQAVRAFFQ